MNIRRSQASRRFETSGRLSILPFRKFMERSKVMEKNLPKALENFPEAVSFREVYLFMRRV
jgi:hypothetical protein